MWRTEFMTGTGLEFCKTDVMREKERERECETGVFSTCVYILQGTVIIFYCIKFLQKCGLFYMKNNTNIAEEKIVCTKQNLLSSQLWFK